MSLLLDLQLATSVTALPSKEEFQWWAAAALEENKPCELTIRIVDSEEGRALNARWRQRGYPTNVLSFPACLPVEIEPLLLGDLVLCAPVIMQEAKEQDKEAYSYWAHMVIHGVLHLQGYDHEEQRQAQIMEEKEANIMAQLGFSDPYGG